MTRKKTVYAVAVLLLFGLLLSSCGDKGDKKEEVMEQRKEAYVSQAEGRLTAFDAKMADFEKRGDTLPQERKQEFNKTVDALKQKRDAAAKSLDTVKKAEGSQTENAKAETDAALQDLENSMNQAAVTFPQ
jgi:predicted  nucleic acid-binding Zn-ribbon protein